MGSQNPLIIDRARNDFGNFESAEDTFSLEIPDPARDMMLKVVVYDMHGDRIGARLFRTEKLWTPRCQRGSIKGLPNPRTLLAVRGLSGRRPQASGTCEGFLASDAGPIVL